MKKTSLLLFLLCFTFLNLTVALAQIKYLHPATAVGKLHYDRYSEYPYFIMGKEIVGVIVAMDKNYKNAQLHPLVGKNVEVQGPMSIITGNNQYHNLKVIDLRKGQGSCKPMR
jgi:hypothetical protein